jgi:hypothetical protein
MHDIVRQRDAILDNQNLTIEQKNEEVCTYASSEFVYYSN